MLIFASGLTNTLHLPSSYETTHRNLTLVLQASFTDKLELGQHIHFKHLFKYIYSIHQHSPHCMQNRTFDPVTACKHH